MRLVSPSIVLFSGRNFVMFQELKFVVDISEQMRVVKGETATRTSFQRSAKGNVSIAECNPEGKFIVLENTNRNKEEHMDEWKLKRKLDGKKEVS